MAETIPLPALKRLWKVRFADSLDTPKVQSTVLVRGAHTAFDAMTQCKKYEGWAAFKAMYPDAEIAGCDFSGHLEN